MLTAATLWACDKNEEAADIDNGQVRFTASIGKEAVAKPQSRAAGTQWAAGDDIGIFMVDHDTNDIAIGANNRQFTTLAGNGIFTPVSENEIFYPMDRRPVYFIAYYPYSGDTKLTDALPVKIAVAQTDDTQRATDLMWTKADNGGSGYSKNETAAPPVALTFSHRLSKLTMNCTVHTSVGDPSLLADATVTIRGMNTRNTFDLISGTLGTPVTPADITARKLSDVPAGFHGACDAIILPGAYADGVLTVDFTINGETYTWKVGEIKFESGSNHVYEVLITRTEVTATGTITDWNTVIIKDPIIVE